MQVNIERKDFLRRNMQETDVSIHICHLVKESLHSLNKY